MKKVLILISFLFNISLFAQQFTIAVIPDSQNYVNYTTQKTLKYPLDSAEIFYNQMKYIADNSKNNGGEIAFAVHVGDFVSHWGERNEEWERAEKGMSFIDGVVPFIAVPGNHDYDKGLNYGEGSRNRIDGGEFYNRYFGPDSKFFKGKEWYKGSYFYGMNSYVIYNIEGQDFLFIGLEVEPSDKALEWAQNVINMNKNYPTILTTHEYLLIGYDPEYPGNSAYCTHHYRKGIAESLNTGEAIWNKLIKSNDQIFMVLCGHVFKNNEGEGVRTDINESGNKVYSLLQDYQGRKELFKSKGLIGKPLNCGDGWLRLLEFDLSKSQIHVKTFNTETSTYEKDQNSDFKIKFDWDWNKRFQKPFCEKK